MTFIGWSQIVLYCAIVVGITPVLGAYMTRVFIGERTVLSTVLQSTRLVGQLRQKIEEHADDPRIILTEPGIGYRIGEA